MQSRESWEIEIILCFKHEKREDWELSLSRNVRPVYRDHSQDNLYVAISFTKLSKNFFMDLQSSDECLQPGLNLA